MQNLVLHWGGNEQTLTWCW